jgi:glycosyltransferase involved in cell wall biosynthesis
MTPLVSILIPAHNAAPWIRDTVGSALAQSWPATEVIVVDDGSTDATRDIVQSLRSPAVRLIAQKRRGPSAAQNEAFRHAQGEFIQRLDADDVLGRDKVAIQMARLQDDPDAIAAGQWARFYARPDEAVFTTSRITEDVAPAEWLVRECQGGGPMLQPGIWLTSRRVMESAGPWDERLTLNNDFEYGVRLLLAARRVLYTPGAHLYYRSGNSASLGSLRSPEGWRSAYLSFELGVNALLAVDGSAPARRAAADLFQVLAFSAYLEHAQVVAACERRVRELGGSEVRMGGGRLFRALERTLGWKPAKRVQRTAYRLGYERSAGPAGRSGRAAGAV